MTENRPSEAVHVCIAPLAGPSAREKLAYAAWHTEFWLTQIATWAIHGIQIQSNCGFVAFRHRQYVGNVPPVVKALHVAGEIYASGVHLGGDGRALGVGEGCR